MMFMPFQIIGVWVRGVLALGLIALAAYLLYQWYDRSHVVEVPARVAVAEPEDQAGDGRPVAQVGRRVFAPRLGWNLPTALLASGLALLALSVLGGPVVAPLLLGGFRGRQAEPGPGRDGDVRRLPRPDGTELHVEIFGPPDGPPIVLSHGWSADHTEWSYLRSRLADRFRLIAWDLPGSGRSTRPADRDFSLDKFARDLDAVASLAGDRPVVLLGHSIGAMTTLNYAKLFPEALGRRVAGLIVVHGTYTNPVRTTSMSGLLTALQKPLIEPLLNLTIWLWPLVRLMNWLSYLNGSMHASSRRSGFCGGEPPGMLDHMARLAATSPPDVIARGMFGMLRYDVTDTLATIAAPALVVAGNRDTTCLPEASLRIAEEVPSARLVELEPAKHLGLLEHNDRFAEVVAEFVDACNRPGRLATTGLEVG